MPVQVQWRRGTRAENLARTGPGGEINVDTDEWSARVQTGELAGGVLLATQHQGIDIASDATLDLDHPDHFGDLHDVTGSATITAILIAPGKSKTLRFTGGAVLQHGSSLVLPGSANITTQTGDFATFRGYPGDVVRCVAYTRATGRPVASSREVLTANRTYYVRTDGSDGNSGLADSSGGAFLTIAKAMAVVAALDLGGFTVTVQVGAGTWTTAIALPALVGGSAVLLGDATTPSNVTLSNATIAANGIGGGWSLRGLKLERSTAGQLLFVTNNAALTFENIHFGSITGGFGYHILATAGGRVQATGNYTISGGANYHWGAFDGASITVQARTVTLTGTPAFSSAFALISRAGVAAVNANTFSGSATGVRYSATGNGVIDAGGGGASYLPGNSAGSTATGGQYL